MVYSLIHKTSNIKYKIQSNIVKNKIKQIYKVYKYKYINNKEYIKKYSYDKNKIYVIYKFSNNIICTYSLSTPNYIHSEIMRNKLRMY